MYYQIYDKNGNRVNTIVANQSFVENYCKVFGLTYKQVEESKPVAVPSEPTTEELLNAMLGVNRYE